MATLLSALVTTARDRILEALALITPGAPLVAPQGTTGATSYGYKIVAKNATGHSIASVAGTTTTGNATLTGVNFNQINWTDVQRATSYDVYRTVGGATQGKIGNTTSTTFNDTGLAGDGVTAPTTNTSGTIGIFWSDDELLQLALLGCRDLWRAYIDLHQDHFFTVAPGPTYPNIVASAETIADVPTDVFRVLLIQPLDTTPSGTNRLVSFVERRYNSPEFLRALSLDPVDPTNAVTVFYDPTNAGAPIGAPTIYIAPKLSAAMNLRMVYIPTLSGSLTASSVNPIPGESDAAIIAYIVAFALAKEREDRSPDPNWLATYKTEKDSCLIASAPRDESAAPVVKGVFDDILGAGLSGSGIDDDW